MPSASFYAAPPTSSAALEKRSGACNESPRPKAPRTDEAFDELDFLTPRPALHARMRLRTGEEPRHLPLPESAAALTVPVRTIFACDEFTAHDNLSLVVGRDSLAVTAHGTERCQVAFRDVNRCELGGPKDALLTLDILPSTLSASSIEAMCGLPEEPHARTLCLALCFDSERDTRYEKMELLLRHSMRVSFLSENARRALIKHLAQHMAQPIRVRDPPSAPPPPILDLSSPSQETMHTDRSHDQERSPSPLAGRERHTRSQSLAAAKAPDVPVVRYPVLGPRAVTLLTSDVKRFDDDEFFNDTLIEFGLRYLYEQIRASHPALAEDMHLFNSFFYMKLTESRDRTKTYEHVRKWTNRVDMYVGA